MPLTIAGPCGLCILFAFAALGSLSAQQSATPEDAAQTAQSAAEAGSSQAPLPSAWTTRVPTTATIPVIDGRLDDAVWADAATIEDFTQIEPIEGATPSEATRVAFLVDADALYIGVWCFDSDPSGIRDTVVTRDARLDPDDRIELVLDTFFDRRNAYFFQIGPGGSKGDALIENNGARFIKPWDGIWRGRVRTDAQGWTAELAIPAKTLGMNEAPQRFGFNLRRIVKRKNEIIEWAEPARERSLFRIVHSGILEGMAPLDPGLGLDVRPFLAGGIARDEVLDDNAYDLDPGLDLVWRLTPSLAATLTVNTDFAETEVDDRVVNLSRFPVFFPERRDFFLQDAGIFAFAGLSGGLEPFFSRRIGIDDTGTEVPLLLGTKLTGRLGGTSLGVLGTFMDETEQVGRKGLGVLRVSQDLGEQSRVGMVATTGDPATGGTNHVVGVDTTLRTSEFLGTRELEWTAFALGSLDQDEGGERERGYAYGWELESDDDLWDWDLGYREVSEDYRPDLGFVRRRGIRRAFGRLAWLPRPGGDLIRRFEFQVQPNVFWSMTEGGVETGDLDLRFFGLLFESGDRIRFTWRLDHEANDRPFTIGDGVEIPAGRRTWNRWQARFEFADKRPLFGSLTLEAGDFFDGKRLTFDASATVRPARGLALSGRWQRNEVRLPTGDFNTNLATLRLEYDFDPFRSLSLFSQYDDLSDSIGINARLRWILEPGDELFVVLNQGFGTRDEADREWRFRSLTTQLAIKLAITYRF